MGSQKDQKKDQKKDLVAKGQETDRKSDRKSIENGRMKNGISKGQDTYSKRIEKGQQTDRSRIANGQKKGQEKDDNPFSIPLFPFLIRFLSFCDPILFVFFLGFLNSILFGKLIAYTICFHIQSHERKYFVITY